MGLVRIIGFLASVAVALWVVNSTIKSLKKSDTKNPVKDKMEEMENTISAAEAINADTVKKYGKAKNKIESLGGDNES